MENNGQQPAFARTILSYSDLDRSMSSDTSTGLTKREYFAAMAMQGILSNGSMMNEMSAATTPNNSLPFVAAETAMIYADQLLKQLES